MPFRGETIPAYETNSSPVPLEVCGLIIANVASKGDDAVNDIQALRLVCKNFIALCTPHLFRHLQISTSKSGVQYMYHLSQLLDTNPMLSKYTRKLTLVCEAPNDSALDLLSNDSTLGPTEIVIKQLISLPNIDSRSIVRPFESQRHSDHPQHTLCAHQGFGYPFYLDGLSPTNRLNTLSISGVMDVPFLQIFLIPNLITLQLKHCSGELSLIEAPATRELALQIKKGNSVSSIKHLSAEYVDIITPIHVARFFPEIETMYLKEIKWDVFTTCWLMDHEWVDLVMFSGAQSLWLSYPKLRKLSSMGAVGFQVAVNQGSDIKQLPALKELELQQIEDWDVQRYERIYRHLSCLEVLRIGGDLPKKGYYRTDLSWYALRAVVGRTRRTLKEINVAQHKLRGCPETTIEVIHDALRSIRTDNVLEVIKLDLSFILTDLKVLRKPFDQWRRFAILLVEGKQDFTCMQEVHILVSLIGPGAIFEGRNKRALEGFLHEPLWQLLTTTMFLVNFEVRIEEAS